MVGGLTKQIQEIKEVIELPIKHPELFESLGVAQPKGVLLYGPPGSGKTLIARKIGKILKAREPKIVNGPEVLDKYVGAAEERIRNLFVDAEKEQVMCAGCISFWGSYSYIIICFHPLGGER